MSAPDQATPVVLPDDTRLHLGGDRTQDTRSAAGVPCRRLRQTTTSSNSTVAPLMRAIPIVCTGARRRSVGEPGLKI